MAWRGLWGGSWVGRWEGTITAAPPGSIYGAATITLAGSGAPVGIGVLSGSATLSTTAAGLLGVAPSESLVGAATLAVSATATLGALGFLVGAATLAVTSTGALRDAASWCSWRYGAWRPGAWRDGSWLCSGGGETPGAVSMRIRFLRRRGR